MTRLDTKPRLGIRQASSTKNAAFCEQKPVFYPFRPNCRREVGTSCSGRGKLFGSFCAVLRPRLPSVLDTNGIQLSAYDVVPNPGEILHAASPDQHYRVFLQVVPLARNVDGDLDAVREPDARHFPQGRVRFLRRRRVHPEADPPLLRTRVERRRIAPLRHGRAALPDKLVDRGHSLTFPSVALSGF